jgi:hypothetical protein
MILSQPGAVPDGGRRVQIDSMVTSDARPARDRSARKPAV